MKRSPPEKVTLRALSAFLVAGRVVPAGGLVEVSEVLAKDLLRRGKADLATLEDAKQAPPAPAAVSVAPQVPVPSDLEKLTKAELLEMARELGVDVKSSDSKAAIIATLESKVK